MKDSVKMCKIFRVWGDGVNMEATASEIAERFGTTASYIHEVAGRYGMIHRKYRVEDTGRKERREFKRNGEIKKPKKPTKLTPFDSVLQNIKLYGNCYTLADPCGYLPDLYDKGYDCTYREATTMDGYVIEVKRYV